MATDKTLKCTVITPEAQVYDGPVESVIVPAHDGELGVLLDRAPLMCKLGPGRMRITKAAGETPESWYVDGGFAQVAGNQIIVLTPRAMRPNEIDRVAAQNLLEESRHITPSDDVSERRKIQLEQRARAQLRIASHQ